MPEVDYKIIAIVALIGVLHPRVAFGWLCAFAVLRVFFH